MKQFSLGEYLKGPSRKVVTRDGRNVRIKCTDAKGDRPVIGLIDCKDAEIPMSFTEKGRLGVNVCDSIIDLFFAPEKYEGYVNIIRNEVYNEAYCGKIYDSKEEAESKANNATIATARIEWEE